MVSQKEDTKCQQTLLHLHLWLLNPSSQQEKNSFCKVYVDVMIKNKNDFLKCLWGRFFAFDVCEDGERLFGVFFFTYYDVDFVFLRSIRFWIIIKFYSKFLLQHFCRLHKKWALKHLKSFSLIFMQFCINF